MQFLFFKHNLAIKTKYCISNHRQCIVEDLKGEKGYLASKGLNRSFVYASWNSQHRSGFQKPNGTLDRPAVYADTYEECRKLLNELIHQRDKGIAPLKKRNITVGELALYYYLKVKPHIATATGTTGIKNSTWNWHVDNVKWYIEKKLSNIPITKFNREIAQRFFDGLSAGAYISDTTNEPIILSANSVKGVKRTLNPVMKYAIQEGYILKNPLEFVAMPADEDTDEDEGALYIERKDLEFIKKELDKQSDLKSILLVMIYTGMRICEVLGLRIRDIDFVNGEVKIRKQSSLLKTRDSEGEIINVVAGTTSPKTKDSRREIDTSDLLKEVLATRLAELKAKNKPELLEPDAFIFCNRQGKMRTYSGTRSIYMRFMEKIGMDKKGYTLHTVRHTFISIMAENGSDMDLVAKYVGHADSKITKKIYSHVTKKTKENIAGAIDKAFDGGDSKEKPEQGNDRATAISTATIPPGECQNEPKTANSENSEVRAWVPVIVETRGGKRSGKTI